MTVAEREARLLVARWREVARWLDDAALELVADATARSAPSSLRQWATWLQVCRPGL